MFRKKRKKVVDSAKKPLRFKILAGVIVFLMVAGLLIVFYRRYMLKNAYLSPLAHSSSFVNSGQSGSVEQFLQKNNISYSSVAYTSNSAVVVLSTGTTVIFSLSKSLQSQTTTLQLITTRLTIEGKKISKIDFTFDRPLVTF